MRPRRRILACLLALGLLAGCGGREDVADTVTVAAAASLRGVLPELLEAYASEAPGVRFEPTYAGSGTLRAQVEAGAPIDGVLLASAHHVDLLIERGKADPGTRTVFAHNRLVLVTGPGSPATSVASLPSLPSRDRIAIGAPDSVPAGRYARDLLRARGLWDALQEHLVPARDVTAVVTYVRRGEAAAGFVYATDALGLDDLRVVERADGPEDPSPTLVGAVVRGGDRAEAFAAFLAWLGSGPARAVLASHGFTVPNTPAVATGARARRASSGSDAFPVWLSLRVALLAMLLVAPLGLLLARMQAHARYRGRTLVDALILLPLVLPPSVIGYYLVVVLGTRGPVGGLLDRWFDARLIFTPAGAVVAAAVVALPLLVKTAQAALEGVPRELERVGRSLGLGPTALFFRVSLPCAWPGITVGLILAFARALGEFGATLMFAGNKPGKTNTMPLEIYAAYLDGRDERAVFYVLLLTSISLGVVFFATTLTGRRVRA